MDKVNDRVIGYRFDQHHQVIGFNYQGKEFLYQRDIVGEIYGIIYKNGKRFVTYAYTAYGVPTIEIPSGLTTLELSQAQAIRDLNIYLYKGYIYDQETGLYYCHTRYYNPRVGRWISIDDINYLDPGSIGGLNLYAYCGNNPVMYTDGYGTSPTKWYDFLAWVGVGLLAASAIVLTAGAAGFVIGGIAGGIIYGAAIGTVAGAVIGAAGGAVGGMIYDAIQGNDFGSSIWDWTKAGFGIGTIVGAITGGTVGYFAAASVKGMTNVAFWTGLGPNGSTIASNAAAQHGLTTIGNTFGGKVVQALTNKFGYSATKFLWVSLSKTMASSVAMNPVTLFYGGKIGAYSVFAMHEAPRLAERAIKIIRVIIGG